MKNFWSNTYRKEHQQTNQQMSHLWVCITLLIPVINQLGNCFRTPGLATFAGLAILFVAILQIVDYIKAEQKTAFKPNIGDCLSIIFLLALEAFGQVNYITAYPVEPFVAISIFVLLGGIAVYTKTIIKIIDGLWN